MEWSLEVLKCDPLSHSREAGPGGKGSSRRLGVPSKDTEHHCTPLRTTGIQQKPCFPGLTPRAWRPSGDQGDQQARAGRQGQ